MMEALVPGLRRGRCALDEVEVGVAWLDRCEPLVRARVADAAARFPRRRAIEFPLEHGAGRLFMREAAESHSGLYPEHADAYGDDVRTKLDRCLGVTDGDVALAERARAEHREKAEEAAAEVDLVVVPTLGFVAPQAGVDELEAREDLLRFTYPINVLGWPALALPCGRAERGLPASVQLIGRPGDDARVLAVGEALEAVLPSPV